ncbi:MAG: hypothetical protein IJS99_01705 [Synergistaceae bacterium]|nr:hypothetical protein [Synergistaceae bacterium]
MAANNLLTDFQELAEETASFIPESDQPEQAAKNVPGFLALKFTFAPSRGDMGGAFCTIFEGQTGKTVFQVFWLAKPYASNALIEPAKDWRSFVKKFTQLGPLDKDWGTKLQEQLKELLPISEKRKLFENYTKVKLRQLESILRRNFETTTQCVFSASIDAEPVSRADLERAKVLKPLAPSADEIAKEQREKEAKEQAYNGNDDKLNKKDGEFEGTLIKCSAVVDPVKGKPSSEIVPGDIIEVVIEGDGASALVRKFLEENDMQPLFPVEEVKRTEGKTLIYVRVNDQIRGFINITKDIRMKIKEDPRNMISQERASHMLENIFFFGLLGIALVGLLFVIRYFFL